jgi:hypothetical protein
MPPDGGDADWNSTTRPDASDSTTSGAADLGAATDPHVEMTNNSRSVRRPNMIG